MSESNTLNIQLAKEDSDRLTQEAKRRQIDRTTLAQILLQKSLANLDFESLENLYNFRQKSEVLDFLEKHPFLIPLLLEAHTHIRQHFPDSPLFLQYITDPEIDFPQLAVYIDRPQELNAEEAIDKLESIDDDWWIDAEPKSQGKMFIGFN